MKVPSVDYEYTRGDSFSHVISLRIKRGKQLIDISADTLRGHIRRIDTSELLAVFSWELITDFQIRRFLSPEAIAALPLDARVVRYNCEWITAAGFVRTFVKGRIILAQDATHV